MKIFSSALTILLVTVFPVKCMIHGRYSRDIHEYETLIPHKVDAQGAFVSYDLRQSHGASGRHRRSAGAEAEARAHYALTLGGRDLLVELQPNTHLLADGVRRTARSALCHWVGRVRVRDGDGGGEGEGGGEGGGEGRAALSTCVPGGGLAGALRLPGGDSYLVEPVAGARPDASGRLQHVAHRHRRQSHYEDEGSEHDPTCGTRGWRDGWRQRFRRELLRGEAPARLRPPPPRPSAAGDPGTDAPADAPRAAFSKKITIELFVVADKEFVDYHKEDSENYLMTILNMASDLWHDSSSGGYYTLSVTHLMYLEKEVDPLELQLGQDASPVLDSFQAWANKLNPTDWNHPNHHDIAVLVTRYDLCSDNVTNCNLLGLASVSAACDPKRSACINEDAGLIAGYTVAHEIGHVMGASHDAGGDPSNPDGCSPEDPDGAGWVMAAYLTPRVSIWSNCSRAFFQALMSQGLGECLLDEPAGLVIRIPQMFPGLQYGPEKQCQMFMDLERTCESKRSLMCENLWCSNGSMCTAEGRPAADGTVCGEGRWCMDQKCVTIGLRPRAVDGGWGGWGAWGPCSRPCGGGIESRERRCDNPLPTRRGRYCVGESRRFRVCNVQDCPEDQPDFRAAQCSEFDSKPWWHDDTLYTWKPRLVPKTPCKLYCINENNVYVSLADAVKDGTPCRPGSNDLCLAGECVPVGCDWELYSKVQENSCGLCGGDESLCNKEETSWTEQGGGYTKILDIPPGASNVRLEEVEPSENMIAISNTDGETYCINGNFREKKDGEYDCGADKLVLSHPETEMDLILMKGPTKETMSAYYVFFGTPNPGVKVTWFTRKEGAVAPSRTYKWEFVEWEECTARCDGGTQVSVAECVVDDGGPVSNSYCEQMPQPEPMSRLCNEQACEAKWIAGEWGPCSGCVSRSGLQRRAVECLREAPHLSQDPTPVPPNACAGAPRPVDVRRCMGKEPCKDDGLLQAQRSEREAEGRCPPTNKSQPFAIGTVQDRAPASMFVLEEVPLVMMPAAHGRPLSEEAQKQMGDVVPTVMADNCKRRVYKGAEADLRLKEIKHHAESQHM